MEWEWLNTVSLLKSELTKDKINPKKLIITKKSWKKVRSIIFLSKGFEVLKFLIEKKVIAIEQNKPKNNE